MMQDLDSKKNTKKILNAYDQIQSDYEINEHLLNSSIDKNNTNIEKESNKKDSSFKFLLFSQNSLENFNSDVKLSESIIKRGSTERHFLKSDENKFNILEPDLPDNLLKLMDMEIDQDEDNYEDLDLINSSEKAQINFLQHGRKIIDETRKSYSSSKNFNSTDQQPFENFYNHNITGNILDSNNIINYFPENMKVSKTNHKKKNNTLDLKFLSDIQPDNSNKKTVYVSKFNETNNIDNLHKDKELSNLKSSLDKFSYDSSVKPSIKKDSKFKKSISDNQSSESSQKNSFLNQNSFINLQFNNSDLFIYQNDNSMHKVSQELK